MIKPMTITDFVIESNRIEGIVRAADDPQLAREIEATIRFSRLHWPKVGDLEEFVRICTWTQPEIGVLRREPGINVRVGDYIAPPGGPEIEKRLEVILEAMVVRGAFETHCLYESLHPFTDGNGRSGRVLWLWQKGGIAPLGFLHAFYYETLQYTKPLEGSE